MMPLLVLNALMAMLVAFFWRPNLLPYTAFLLLASLVVWGRKASFARRRSWGTGALLAGPIALVSLSMIFNNASEPLISLLAGAFDKCFSDFFGGIARASEELAALGHAHRITSIKGYAVLVFILCSVFAWKFLCETTTFENMDLDKVAMSRGKPWLGTCFAIAMVGGLLLLFIMALDPYNPLCQRRCSGIQRNNFPYFQMLTFAFSILYFFVAAGVGLIFSRFASLPSSFDKTPSAG